jgi:hypothetical protein
MPRETSREKSDRLFNVRSPCQHVRPAIPNVLTFPQTLQSCLNLDSKVRMMPRSREWRRSASLSQTTTVSRASYGVIPDRRAPFIPSVHAGARGGMHFRVVIRNLAVRVTIPCSLAGLSSVLQ